MALFMRCSAIDFQRYHMFLITLLKLVVLLRTLIRVKSIEIILVHLLVLHHLWVLELSWFNGVPVLNVWVRLRAIISRKFILLLILILLKLGPPLDHSPPVPPNKTINGNLEHICWDILYDELILFILIGNLLIDLYYQYYARDYATYDGNNENRPELNTDSPPVVVSVIEGPPNNIVGCKKLRDHHQQLQPGELLVREHLLSNIQEREGDTQEQ